MPDGSTFPAGVGHNSSPIWSPQDGPQLDAIQATWCAELFYGGAAGGGKSDFLLGDYLQDVNTYGSAWRGVIFRRSYPELEELISRSREMYPVTGARYREDTKTWTWPVGATLKMRYLERNADALRYHGHQYCVERSTPVLMGDGTWKRIASVRMGEMVQTLLGPRRVRATVRPYLAPCVRMRVRRPDGVREQVHPVWHPVMTAFGDWSAWSEGDRNDCRATSRSSPGEPPPGASFALVALHAPELLSARCGFPSPPSRPTQSHSLGKSAVPSLAISRTMSDCASDRPQLLARAGSPPDRAAQTSPNALAYARRASGEASGSSARYATGRDPCGGRAPSASGSVQGDTPSPRDVGAQPPGSLPGDLVAIPRHSRLAQGCWVHPYTGLELPASEAVAACWAEHEPCGDAWVCDLMVDDANHYITEAGLINKNTWIGWDELTQWHSLWPYRYLRSRLRSAHNVPTKRIRAAANPGGASHIEVKSYFVDVAPAGVPYLDAETGIERMFIPARLNDNRILVTNDPTYRGRLRALGGNLARAMEDGDWSIIEGAFFDNWSQARNVVQPFKVPGGWTKFVSLDWGSAKPFSVGWWAVCDDPYETTNANGDPVIIPRGAMVRYREWYGSTGEPNVGLKLTAEKVSDGIKARELTREEHRDPRTGQMVAAEYETIAYRVADPSIAKMDGGPSIRERMSPATGWRMADNARVATQGAVGGWDQMRSRINGDLELDDDGGLIHDGGAMLLVFTTCKDFLRTVPVLQHDQTRPEDIDTDAEDHAADEARYACMSRPYARERPKPKPAEPRGISNMTFDEMMKLQERIERNRLIG